MAYTTIDDPSAHFQTTTYTGNNGSQSITLNGNSNLQADWGWWKRRNTAADHSLIDSSRGVTKHLVSNTSGAEQTASAGTELVSFDSNGFTLGAVNVTNSLNGNSDSIVAWLWKANGGTTSSNTDGSITTTVQANTTAGFSIVTYTGNATDNATIGHGLGATPEWVIIKNRASSIDWAIGHKSIFGNNAENLRFTTSAVASADDAGGSHFSRNAPSSTVITLGDGGDGDFSTDTNRAETHVAYCFTSIKGYSKFGSYTGNGNADGPFIYTGFKPAWLMVKKTVGNARAWVIHDNKRDIDNPTASRLDANTNEADQSSGHFDFLSNGFKCRSTEGATNQDTRTFIYMTFAEHPFVSSKGVPVTAR